MNATADFGTRAPQAEYTVVPPTDVAVNMQHCKK